MHRSYMLFSFTILLLSAFQTQAYSYVASSKTSGYVNINIGATQFGFVDEILSDYEITPSPSLEVLFGGRIGRSQHTWFEFSYSYNGAFKTEETIDTENEETTYRVQNIAMGIKLTTAPHKKAAAYARLGGGRLMYEARVETFLNGTSTLVSNDYETKLTNHGYLGLGANFAISRHARLGLEVKQMQYNLVSNAFTDNSVMLTFTRYLK